MTFRFRNFRLFSFILIRYSYYRTHTAQKLPQRFPIETISRAIQFQFKIFYYLDIFNLAANQKCRINCIVTQHWEIHYKKVWTNWFRYFGICGQQSKNDFWFGWSFWFDVQICISGTLKLYLNRYAIETEINLDYYL